MSQPFVAQIQPYGFGFAPRTWALCNGQTLSIAQNTALFSLLGTQFGGNGQSTFALPDLQGNVAINQGQGAGLSPRFMGEVGGTESVTLLQTEIPSHSHAMQAAGGLGNRLTPASNVLSRVTGATPYAPSNSAQAAMAAQSVQAVGGNQPHNNMMQYLVLNFVIALQGIFPARG